MRLCVAQTRPLKGDIAGNIARHKAFVNLAADLKADMILFPELSLTGYEPSLAKKLAIDAGDTRLNDFQQMSDSRQITIGVGAPTKTGEGTAISMLLFQPNKARQTYSKKYLHPDEYPFFVSGQNYSELTVKSTPVALAICYELSIEQHTVEAMKHGAKVYLASVAKSASGVEKSATILSHTAKKYAATVAMANCLGPSDDFVGAGRSAFWNSKGELIARLSETDEALLLMDTHTGEVIEKPIFNTKTSTL